MANKKSYYYADYMDVAHLDLIMLEDILRTVVKKTPSYIKIGLTNSKDKPEPSDFSELSKVLNVEKNNFDITFINNPGVDSHDWYHIWVYRKNDDECIVSVDFYDFGMYLYIDNKTKKKLENKYDLQIITRKKRYDDIGLTAHLKKQALKKKSKSK